MKDSVIITIPSHPKYLCVVRAAAARIAETGGFSDAARDEITRGIDEACSNVIKYAYKGENTKRIVVKFKVTENQFKVTIDDTGIKADVEVLKGRNLDDVRPGGLGMHLIKRAFDISSFDKKKKKGNRLTLIRHIKEKNGDRDRGL